jgi:hypothetical protein
MTDAIVVGSGASAAHAAWRLVESGLSVLMLDVGYRDDKYASLIPDKPWSEIRRTDPQQHRYFLGDDFEGVPLGAVRVGAQLTPPRLHIQRGTAELTPVQSQTWAGMDTLAIGGLGAGWGAGVGRFTDDDLARTPLRAVDLVPHYEAVEQRVGISGEPDDLSAELGEHVAMMPALRPDSSSRALLERYIARREWAHAKGLRMGITRLAACSRPFRGRDAHRYDDLDFWADKGRSVYRPRWTVEELKAKPNFRYVDRHLVLRFDEANDKVRVTARRLDTGKEAVLEARRLVLAAGALGTARIVLRSLGLFDRPVPVVTNPYTYAACLNTNALGLELDDARHSLSQLTAVFTPEPAARPLHVSVYSYRSLLNFKLMKEIPLAADLSRPLVQALIPALTILGIHHPAESDPGQFALLRRGHEGGPDRLEIHFESTAADQAMDRHEPGLLSTFRAFGCWSVRRIRPGHGSSIHYGGTLPMSREPSELQTGVDGLLYGTGRVHVADGSLLGSFPAKGLTLTLMAGGDRIGALVAEKLRE